MCDLWLKFMFTGIWRLLSVKGSTWDEFDRYGMNIGSEPADGHMDLSIYYQVFDVDRPSERSLLYPPYFSMLIPFNTYFLSPRAAALFIAVLSTSIFYIYSLPMSCAEKMIPSERRLNEWYNVNEYGVVNR